MVYSNHLFFFHIFNMYLLESREEPLEICKMQFVNPVIADYKDVLYLNEIHTARLHPC